LDKSLLFIRRQIPRCLSGGLTNTHRDGGSSKPRPINFLTSQSEQSLTQKLHGSKIDRIYDEAGNVVETQEHKGDFKEW